MRFSLAVTALAAGAVAAVAPSQEEEITVTVTDYTTYCPSSTMTDVRSYSVVIRPIQSVLMNAAPSVHHLRRPDLQHHSSSADHHRHPLHRVVSPLIYTYIYIYNAKC